MRIYSRATTLPAGLGKVDKSGKATSSLLCMDLIFVPLLGLSVKSFGESLWAEGSVCDSVPFAVAPVIRWRFLAKLVFMICASSVSQPAEVSSTPPFYFRRLGLQVSFLDCISLSSQSDSNRLL